MDQLPIDRGFRQASLWGERFHGWEDRALDGTVNNVAGAAGQIDGSRCVRVTLADGSVLPLAGLSRQDLLTLQWQQEQQFATQILAAPKGSPDRAEVLRHTYDTVTQLFAAAQGFLEEPLRMGLHPRQERLVLETLKRQRRRKMEPRFFEIGYSSGVLLERVAGAGFPMAGIEVSAAMRRQAVQRLGPEHAPQLYLGDFLRAEILQTAGPFTLVYWNNVFEHVPPDEILNYLRRIHEILVPGGQLITITPNWHLRPSDVTRAFHPPRTTAAGVHLKEYTLREVTALCAETGFPRVATPLVVLPRRMVLCGDGLAGLKRVAERLGDFALRVDQPFLPRRRDVHDHRHQRSFPRRADFSPPRAGRAGFSPLGAD